MAYTISGNSTRTDVYVPQDGETASAATLVSQTLQPIVNNISRIEWHVRGLKQFAVRQPVDIASGFTTNTGWAERTVPTCRRYWQQTDYGSTPEYNLFFEITHLLPATGKISAIGCELLGKSRSVLPASQYLPKLRLRWRSRTTTPGSTDAYEAPFDCTDGSANVADYVAIHTLESNVSIGNYHTFDLSRRYFIEVIGESPNAYVQNDLFIESVYFKVVGL